MNATSLKRSRQALEVHCWGAHVGSLALDPVYGHYAFAFTPEFVAQGVELSPLIMPASADKVYMFAELAVPTYGRLPPLFSDALPSGFGVQLYCQWLLDKGIEPASCTVLDRLSFMGDRSVGALHFRPASGPRYRSPSLLNVGAFQALASTMTEGRLRSMEHLGGDFQRLVSVGTCAGGVKPKAAVLWNRNNGELRSGHLAAPPGFEHFILKLHSAGDSPGLDGHEGRLEYAYFLMARAAGIEMTDCEIIDVDGRSYFMTKRFDREGGDIRHHVQSLCAMAQVDFRQMGANSYSQLYLAIERLGIPYNGKEEAFRRMVFNVLTRNCDDHSRNFSFLLRQDSKRWELAPAYDMTFSLNLSSTRAPHQSMAVNGKYKDITQRDLVAEAKRWGLCSASNLIEQVRDAVDRWQEVAELGGVPNWLASEISARRQYLR